MADVNGILINKKKSEHAENLINPNSTFDRDLVWTVNGSGTVTHSGDRVFAGRKALKVDWTDMTSSLEFYTNDQQVTAPYTGYYQFTHEINEVSTNPTLPCGLDYEIKFFKNGSGSPFQVQQQAADSNTTRNKWNCFSQRIFLNQNDVLTFKIEFKFGQELLGSVVHYLDGFKLEFDDKKLNGVPTIYTTPLPIEGTAALTFPSVAAGETQVLTATVTGAVEFNTVRLGVPFASQNDNLQYSAEVTADDTVTIKCFNSSAAPIVPTTGDFTFKIDR